MAKRIDLVSCFDLPNPTLFTLKETVYEVGTIFNPGPNYAILIMQQFTVIARGKPGEPIPLDRRHTKLKKGLFAKTVDRIRVFAVKTLYQGSETDHDFRGYDPIARSCGKHRSVHVELSYAYNFTLGKDNLWDFVKVCLKGKMTTIQMEKERFWGTICPSNYIETSIKLFTAKFFDENQVLNLGYHVIEAGKDPLGPAGERYNNLMAEVEKSVWKDLACFTNAGRKPLSIYVSNVTY